MTYKKFLFAVFGSLLATSSASAGTVWVVGWDVEAGHSRLLGFDEETGEQLHSIDGESISAVDICKETGTAYYLDAVTLKSVDSNGTVTIIEENLGEYFSGVPQVKVGQRYCTVWAYSLHGGQNMHIVRNPGTSDQLRIDTVAFDVIAGADIDDTNDDLWIGQYNGRVYRVSKKTGLRSYRIASTGSPINYMAVSNGSVHVLRGDGLTGYSNTTRREAPQQLYFDTSYQDLLDDSATFSEARLYINDLGEPVINAFNYRWDNWDGGPDLSTSHIARREMDIENGGLAGTNDIFTPFGELGGDQFIHSVLVPGGNRNLWIYNKDVLRLFDPSGVTLREINYRQVHSVFYPYVLAY